MKKSQKKSINLALQGGGAHGALTWGVLDALLEDGRITFEAVSGTSAGAMNALAMADGYCENGVDGARASLEQFWSGVADQARFSPMQRTVWGRFMGQFAGAWGMSEAFSQAFGNTVFDLFSRVASPYDFNPLNLNPLRDMISNMIDFEKIRAHDHFKIFVAATNVHTGKVRVFQRHEMSADALMASACLPFLFQAVEIDGVPYWDGGYMGNPVLYPLFYQSKTPDIVLVSINPIERNTTPRSARDIQDRLNEITFNASLLRELRAIDFVARLVDDGKLPHESYKHMLMHRISADHDMEELTASSKLNAEWDFLIFLRDLGRKTAQQWLVDHFDDLGQRSSLDLRALYS